MPITYTHVTVSFKWLSNCFARLNFATVQHSFQESILSVSICILLKLSRKSLPSKLGIPRIFYVPFSYSLLHWNKHILKPSLLTVQSMYGRVLYCLCTYIMEPKMSNSDHGCEKIDYQAKFDNWMPPCFEGEGQKALCFRPCFWLEKRFSYQVPKCKWKIKTFSIADN